MPGKRLNSAKPRCPQVHRRDTSRVPSAGGPCGQRGPRPPEDLTPKTVASLHGVPRVGSPASSVIRSTPTSCHPSRLASLPSLRGTAAASWASLPQTPDAASTGLGLLTGLPKTGFAGGDGRTSQVPGGPQCERALLFDPGGTVARGHCCASMLPSAISTASAPAKTLISRLNHTARSLAVYASQGGLPHRYARLASGWLASLSGRD